jgi:GTP-binding protein
MKPIVAIVGRPNVGKSTLFNRVVGEQVAIVEEKPGTTRDRLYADSDWNGREFTLVDTGGLEPEPGTDLDLRVREQAEMAIREADVIVFVVDCRAGVTAQDMEVADALRRSQKPVLVAANKADSEQHIAQAATFYQLGVGEVLPISALHGLGTGDLLDRIVEQFGPAGPAPAELEEGEAVKIAIVGRPNAGKSSLLNALLGRERAIVTEIPGTTRDAIDTEMQYQGRDLVLIDTAGIRRRGRIRPGVEQYGVIRALRAINRADVCVLLLDATEGVTAQDTHLAGYVRDSFRGLVLAVNKWDLKDEIGRTKQDFVQEIRSELNFVPYAPVLFLSAKTGQGTEQVLPAALRVASEMAKRVPTSGLNDVVSEIVATNAPPSHRGRQLKLFYATQVGVKPPSFVFFVNDPSLVHFSYQRFLENRLREFFGFEGTPLRITFRSRGGKEEGR